MATSKGRAVREIKSQIKIKLKPSLKTTRIPLKSNPIFIGNPPSSLHFLVAMVKKTRELKRKKTT